MDRVILGITLGSWVATTVLYWAGLAKWDWMRRRFPEAARGGHGGVAGGASEIRGARRFWCASRSAPEFFCLWPVAQRGCGCRSICSRASSVPSPGQQRSRACVGYAAGEAAMRVMGHLSRAGEVLAAIVVTASIFGGLRWQRKRNVRKEQKKMRRATRSGPGTIPGSTPVLSDEGGSL